MPNILFNVFFFVSLPKITGNMTKRLFSLGILLIMCTTLSQSVMAQDDSKIVTLHLLGTTDVHGAFFPIDFLNNKPAEGSMARISTYVNKLRSLNPDGVILLDNGDILQGQPTNYYYNFIKTDVPNVAAEVVNYLHYDAQVFGNHDIEPGHPVYDKWASEVKCPVLGANILLLPERECYTKPYAIIERQGVKVAVIGMLTPAIPFWLNESIWSGLHFEEMVETAKYWVNYLREGRKADVIVGLFHSGWDDGISTPTYDENATEKIAEQVPGFDVIFYGHDHIARNETTDNGVLCLNPANNAVKVGHAILKLSTDSNGQWVIREKKGELVDVRGEAIDQSYVDHFKPYTDSVTTYINDYIGNLTSAIRSSDCYFGSAPFTDMIHQLQLRLTGADISITAPLQFNMVIGPGKIFMRDMFKLYRFENRLCTVYMTGEEIRKHLEMSYDLWVNTMTEPDDHIMLLNDDSRNDNQRSGFKNYTFNFDSAAGIDYEVDVTKPNGKKVHIIKMSNGKPFDEKKWYKVAMNSYRYHGGGELLTAGAGIPSDSLHRRLIDMSSLDLRHYLTEEIRREGSITPKSNNNWRFVPVSWAAPAIKRDRKKLFGK